MLTLLRKAVSDRVDARAFVAFRSVVGAVALLKGLHLGMRIGDLLDRPHLPWLAGTPDVITPLTGFLLVLVWLAAAIALAAGRRPRLAAGVLAALAGLLMVLESGVYNQHLYLLGLICLLVSLVEVRPNAMADDHAGATASVPRWPLLLLMFQMSVVYGFGALAKLSIDFATGRVLFTILIQQPVARVAGDLLASAAILVPLSMATILVELYLAFGAWFPRARAAVLAVAGPLHVAMLILLPLNLGGFLALLVFGSLQVSILLFLFAPEDRLLVVWDDRCSFCSRWVAGFRRLDWLGRIELQPVSRPAAYAASGISHDAALEALQLRAPDGSINGGFEAVRKIAYVLPATMLFAPWLSLKPVRALGATAYRRVARRRQCATLAAST
jgi:predicted DCC family thiol-disulfide oxidoreductase YuxK